jgi:hypothetical protein
MQMVKYTYWWAGIAGDTRGTSRIFHLMEETHFLRLSIYHHFTAATECINKSVHMVYVYKILFNARYTEILTFMGPCIVRIFQYISNKMQRYTIYFIWKLLYMFRMVPLPIIRSANKCTYSIWYLSHRYVTHSTLKPVPTLPR